MVLLYIAGHEFWSHNLNLDEFPEGRGVPASLEIKTKVAASSLGPAVQSVIADLLYCTRGDVVVKENIPRKHMGQILHQAIMMQFEYSGYVVER